jgi:fructokinase
MKAISFGEILFDVIGDVEHLGGAPFNLAAHLAKLGDESWIISAVGADARGEKIKAEAKKLGVHDDFLQTNKYPTGYVEVEIDAAGKPTYEIHENVAWDNIEAVMFKETFDCFCLGTLAQRSLISRNALKQILENLETEEVFYDVNLRQNYFSREIIEASLSFSTIIKLNDEEAVVLSKLLFNEERDEASFTKKIQEEYNVKIVIITRGSKGCVVFAEDDTAEIPGIKIEVKDTVGAGDAFSAGFLHKYFETRNIKESAEFANKLGAYVASKSGAIPN